MNCAHEDESTMADCVQCAPHSSCAATRLNFAYNFACKHHWSSLWLDTLIRFPFEHNFYFRIAPSICVRFGRTESGWDTRDAVAYENRTIEMNENLARPGREGNSSHLAIKRFLQSRMCESNARFDGICRRRRLFVNLWARRFAKYFRH